MKHYHISWSRKTGNILDWERFSTPEEAKDSAQRLALPGENYGIEQFNGDCPQCAENMKRRANKERGSTSP